MKAVARVTALLLLVIVAGCGRSQPAPPPVVLPAGAATVVAQWSVEGGFVPVTSNLIQVPDLVVYSDGRAIAEAGTELTLPTTEVTTLVNDLNGYLNGMTGRVIADSEIQVADAPTTVFMVLLATGDLKTVSAEALTIEDGYPDELLAADRMMRALTDRVRAEGTPYTADRIRMVVSPVDGDTSIARPWPSSLPEPAGLGPSVPGRAVDLTGADAALVIREFGPNYWQERPFESILRLADGRRVAMLWRYLLPTE